MELMGEGYISPSPDMPILGSSNSTANYNMMLLKLTNGDTSF